MTKQKETTKRCPKCGSTTLALLHSQNVKICADCNHEFTWRLDKGQKSIY